MAKVRVRPETGTLYLDFNVRSSRCREQTSLADTPGNRKAVEALAKRIEKAQAKGNFDYREFFPDSPRAKAFDVQVAPESPTLAVAVADGLNGAVQQTPTFTEFANLWFEESLPRWRRVHQDAIRHTLDRYLIPYFGTKHLSEITRGDLLGFRAETAKRKGRSGQTISAKRINKLMAQVKAILEDGCDRYRLNSPGRGIKALKQKRSDIQPFSLDEANKLIATVREDYRWYLTVRFLTGLRTGEANGLQWIDIDFEANTLKVERTQSRNGDGETKTEASRRIIELVPQVRTALEEQKKLALPGCPWVFHTIHGNPIDLVNFTNRVWYPLLRHLGLKQRPPYQMRHTAATLMLASGENPEWVASVLGHTTTEMLFRVYSRFVPNLTRNDGRAFAGLLNAGKAKKPNGGADRASTDLTSLSRDQLEALIRSMTTNNDKDNKHAA